MTKRYFEISKGKREILINTAILPNLPDNDRIDIKNKINSLLNKYEGLDSDVLSILILAANQNRFEYFFQKLDVYYSVGPKYKPVNERRPISFEYMASDYLLKLYQEMAKTIESDWDN